MTSTWRRRATGPPSASGPRGTLIRMFHVGVCLQPSLLPPGLPTKSVLVTLLLPEWHTEEKDALELGDWNGARR